MTEIEQRRATKLFRLRHKAGFTNSASAAKAMGSSPAQWARWESVGWKKIQISRQLAQYFGVPVAYFEGAGVVDGGERVRARRLGDLARVAAQMGRELAALQQTCEQLMGLLTTHPAERGENGEEKHPTARGPLARPPTGNADSDTL